MENQDPNFLSDNLLDPEELLKNSKKKDEKKVIKFQDGLLERNEKRILTQDGRELLTEEDNRQIL